MKDKLASVLPSHMIASRRKVEYERKVLAKYAEMSQFGFVDMKVYVDITCQSIFREQAETAYSCNVAA